LRILKKFLFVYFAGSHPFFRIFVSSMAKSVSDEFAQSRHDDNEGDDDDDDDESLW